MTRLMVLVLVLLAACSPATYAFTPASGRPISARPDNCKVEVLTSPPSKNFEDIGILEYYSGTEPKTTDEFGKLVTKQVCQVGGDAVIASSDDKGHIMKGQIIKYLGETPPPAPAMPEATPDSEKPPKK